MADTNVEKIQNVLWRTISPFTSLWENATGLERPLWRDISRYQYPYNVSVAVANGVHGFIFRAGISWGYIDPWFQNYWMQADGMGVFKTSYHVIYTDQPIIKQADNWYRIHPERDIVPRVIDLEVDRGDSFASKADATWEMSEIVKQRDGIRPLIYSRYLLLNAWLKSWTTEMLNEHYYILAQFLYDRTNEHPGPATLPDRVQRDRVVLHQTADKKPGFSGEAGSLSVDYERWELGDELAMYQWISKNWNDQTQPPVPGDDYQKQIDALRVQLDVTANLAHVNSGLIDVHETRINNLQDDLLNLRNEFDNHGHDSDDNNGPVYREYIVTDPEKTLACYINGYNSKGFPIIKDQLYDPRIRWDTGDHLFAEVTPLRADGSTYWHHLREGQNGKNVVPGDPMLFVNSTDVEPV